MKLKNSNCDETKKLKWGHNFKKSNGEKFPNTPKYPPNTAIVNLKYHQIPPRSPKIPKYPPFSNPQIPRLTNGPTVNGAPSKKK